MEVTVDAAELLAGLDHPGGAPAPRHLPVTRASSPLSGVAISRRRGHSTSAGIAGAPLEIVSSRAGHLWDALCQAYPRLGLDHAAGGDEVFRDLVLARIIEPTSKQDSLRVLAETAVPAVSYRP